MAQLFERVHGGIPGDRAYYRRVCAGAGTVLELGCGSGRILLEAAVSARRAVGLDSNHGRIALACSRRNSVASDERARFLVGDMSAFALAARFDRVLLPYSGLFCLLSDTDVRACFASVREHLVPEGRFVLDAYHVSREDQLEVSAEPEALEPFELGDVRVEVQEVRSWDPARQRADARYPHLLRSDTGDREWSYGIEQRYLHLDQLESLLEAEGFVVHRAWGGFEGEPLDEDSEHLVLECVVEG